MFYQINSLQLYQSDKLTDTDNSAFSPRVSVDSAQMSPRKSIFFYVFPGFSESLFSLAFPANANLEFSQMAVSAIQGITPPHSGTCGANATRRRHRRGMLRENSIYDPVPGEQGVQHALSARIRPWHAVHCEQARCVSVTRSKGKVFELHVCMYSVLTLEFPRTSWLAWLWHPTMIYHQFESFV